MRLVRFGMALFLLATGATAESAQFILAPGEFRVMELHVPQTPLRVEAAYQILPAPGSPAIHMELLPKGALRAMLRGDAHEALAATAAGASGTFRKVIEEPGDYRLIVSNRVNAGPATLILNYRTSLNADTVATELSPARRGTVIVISFILFFAMVGYSGWKLKRSTLA